MTTNDTIPYGLTFNLEQAHRRHSALITRAAQGDPTIGTAQIDQAWFDVKNAERAIEGYKETVQTLEAQRVAEQRQRDHEAVQELERLKQQHRAHFKGTRDQFEEVWPQIRAEWQREQMRQSMTKQVDQLRAHGNYDAL